MEEEEDSVQRRKHGSSSKGTLRDGLRGEKKIFRAYDAEEVQEKLNVSSCNRSVTFHHIPNFGMFL